jgi:prepilin-type N-terminal cleavage/methylation domain-containing protein
MKIKPVTQKQSLPPRSSLITRHSSLVTFLPHSPATPKQCEGGSPTCLRSSLVTRHLSLPHSFTLAKQRVRAAFTLLELLVVIGIIAIVAAFLIPSLGTNSGRTLDGATHQFTADLENARLIAIAERTRTRVLLPTSNSEFSATSTPTPWPTAIARRGYVITSQKKTDTVWKQRGKWTRLPEGVALQSIAPTPTPTAVPIDVGGTGATTYTFSGPYIEFLANGSSNLDPSVSPAPAATLASGFVNSAGTITQTNTSLKSIVTVDPLTGSVSVR